MFGTDEHGEEAAEHAALSGARKVKVAGGVRGEEVDAVGLVLANEVDGIVVTVEDWNGDVVHTLWFTRGCAEEQGGSIAAREKSDDETRMIQAQQRRRTDDAADSNAA
jgi:hypothetical protein